MALSIVDAGLGSDANLTHHYTFDSNSNDRVGSSNGTDTNTPTYTAGQFSNAITCVAASSQYTTMANTIIPWGTATLWVHLWFKHSSISSTQSYMMTSTTGPGKGLQIYYTGSDIVFAKVGAAQINYTWTGEDTNWHMLDCYADGSGMVMYLDNANVASGANAANFVDPNGQGVRVAAYENDGSLQAGWYLDGQLDDLAIFTRIPTSQELTDLYSGSLTDIKTFNGLAYASTKTVNGLAIASVKTKNGLA